MVRLGIIAAFALTGCSVVNGYPEVDLDEPTAVEDPEPVPVATPWLAQIGGAGQDVATAITTTAEGNLVVAGQFEQSIDLGIGALHSYGDQDAFVAGLDRDGNTLWNVAWGGTANDLVDGMVVMDDGDVVVAFAFSGVADLGGTVLEGFPFGFGLIRYRTTGEIVWARAFSGFDTRTWGSLRTTPDGGLVLTGILGGTVDMGTGPVTSVGQSDIFVLRLDGDGQSLWCQHFPSLVAADPSFANFVKPRVGPDGSVYLAGWIDSGIDFVEAQIPLGMTTPYLAKLDPSGDVAWVQSPTIADTQQVFKDVAVMRDESVVTIGAYMVNNGGVSHPGGLVIARYAADGTVMREQRFPATPTAGWSVFPLSIDETPDGDLAVVGSIGADLPLGEDLLVAVGGQDTFVALFDSTLAPARARRFGDNNDQAPWAATVDPQGSLLLAGGFEGQLRIDQQSVVSAGASDAFVAKIVW